MLLGVRELPGDRPVAVVLPAGQVAEILTGVPASPAPAAEEYVAGLFAWRGQSRALWDATAWAGLRSPGGRAEKVVVAAAGGGTVGLLATDARMVPVDPQTVSSRCPLDLRADRVAGVYDTTDTTLLDLAWPN